MEIPSPLLKINIQRTAHPSWGIHALAARLEGGFTIWSGAMALFERWERAGATYQKLWIYIYRYTYIYMYTYTYIHIYIHMYIYIHIWKYHGFFRLETIRKWWILHWSNCFYFSKSCHFISWGWVNWTDTTTSLDDNLTHPIAIRCILITTINTLMWHPNNLILP
jgi:hypothetical protein